MYIYVNITGTILAKIIKELDKELDLKIPNARSNLQICIDRGDGTIVNYINVGTY
jgi:hypothetical protein